MLVNASNPRCSKNSRFPISYYICVVLFCLGFNIYNLLWPVGSSLKTELALELDGSLSLPLQAPPMTLKASLVIFCYALSMKQPRLSPYLFLLLSNAPYLYFMCYGTLRSMNFQSTWTGSLCMEGVKVGPGIKCSTGIQSCK